MRKLLKDTKYFSQIDLNKNKNINFNKLAYRSGIKIWWLCSKGHSYRATPHHKTRGRKCPYCTTGTKKVSIEKSILKIKPELAKLWHPTKNGNLKPSEVNAGSRKRCWFLCKKGHEFKISPHQKGYRFTCPYCSGKKVTHDNNLEYLYPLIAKEWYPKKNKLKPKDYTPGSNHKAWWVCKKNHIYKQSIKAKARMGYSCPKCHTQVSKVQLKIYCELKNIFKKIKLGKILNKIEIDIFIPNLSLGIEYDGSYYHHNKFKKDKEKNRKLKKMNISLIRLRESPLKKISKNDLIVSSYNMKKGDLDKLLFKIKGLKRLNNESKNLINKYLLSKAFLRENEYRKLLENYPYPQLEKSLPYKYPDLIEEWDYKKNRDLDPKIFSYSSHEKVWWLCRSFKHSWKATIGDRTLKNAGCPVCNKIEMRERFIRMNKSRIGKKRAW